MDNLDTSIKALITDPVIQQRLAKYLVAKCFRNSLLEDLHAGITPGSKSGDYSDVVVSSPYGEIAWNQLSRISDTEMKALMIDVVNRTYLFIQELFDEEKAGDFMIWLADKDPVPGWESPSVR